MKSPSRNKSKYKNPNRLPHKGSRTYEGYCLLISETGLSTLQWNTKEIRNIINYLENMYLFDIRSFSRPKEDGYTYKTYRIVGRYVGDVYIDYLAGMNLDELKLPTG